MIKSALFSVIFLLFPLVSLANNFYTLDFNPRADFNAFTYSNHTAIDNSSNSSASLFLPMALSFDNSPLSLHIAPFAKAYSSGYKKASFASAYADLSLDKLSLKLGRQNLYNQDNPYIFYFAEDNNFDNNMPNYLDSVSLEYFSKALYFQTFASEDIFGAYSKIKPFSFFSVSPFVYAKEDNKDKLHIYGASAEIIFSKSFSLHGSYAINDGKQEYKMFNSSFDKDYKGSLLIIGSKLSMPSDFAEFDIKFDWIKYSEANKNKTFFTPLSKYNLYGDIAGSDNIFEMPVNALKLNIEMKPYKLEEFLVRGKIFYYYSAIGEYNSKELGGEMDIEAIICLEKYDIGLRYGIFRGEEGARELKSGIGKKAIHKAGVYLTLKTLL